jgi:hypothetical protein
MPSVLIGESVLRTLTELVSSRLAVMHMVSNFSEAYKLHYEAKMDQSLYQATPPQWTTRNGCQQ